MSQKHVIARVDLFQELTLAESACKSVFRINFSFRLGFEKMETMLVRSVGAECCQRRSERDGL